MAKNPPDNAGEAGLIPGSGRSTGEGNWYHSSILENPMDRGAWWATVHRATKSWTQLSDGACTQACRTFPEFQRVVN